MSSDMNILESVEIYFPLSPLQEALKYTKHSGHSPFESTCILPSLQQEVKLTVTKTDCHLKIHVDKLCFQRKNDLLECMLNPIQCKKEVPEIGTDATHQVKRKRGRPRKAESPKKNEEKSQTQSDAISITDASSSKDAMETECTVDLSDSIKRYGLRGRKLNSRLMAVEKGSELSGDDNDDDDLEIQAVSDEDFSPQDNDDSDGDYELNKKPKVRATIKVKNQTSSDLKENIERNSRKKMIDQINAILSESDSALLGHLKHYTKVYCKFCDKVFKHSSRLSTHVENDHSNCENIEQYLKELHDLKMLACDACNETFDNSTALLKHMTEKHQLKSEMKCPRCDFITKNLQSLKLHVRNMHLESGIKKAFCHLCTAAFRSHGSLKQHIEVNHLGNKHAKCETCNKMFYNKSQLRRHSKIHGLDLSKRVFCQVCSKSFNFEYNLKRHMVAVHQTQSESFHCSYCGKGFSQKAPMISHVKLVHFNLYPYFCKVCKCSFPRASMLREHMMIAHEQPDYQVPIPAKNSLYDKTDDDKFFCSYCSTGFVHKIRLIEHMHKDHADAFPYKCDTCVQGFLEKSFLAHHSMKVHGILLQVDETEHSEQAGQIMQVITTRSGCPSKIMQTVEVQDTENTTEGEELIAQSSSQDETLIASEAIQTSQSDQAESTSLLVEVDSGTGTMRYVIEAPSTMSQLGSEAMVHDIANLLLAAKQNNSEEWSEEQYSENTAEHEVSLIINETDTTGGDPNIQGQKQKELQVVQQHAGQELVQHIEQELVQETHSHTIDQPGQYTIQHGQEIVELTEHETVQQIVEVGYDQPMEHINTVQSEDINNQQELPMEIVIDQNNENCVTFTVENTSEHLNVAHTDVIELNDKSDGANYYQIINVVNNAGDTLLGNSI